MVVLDGTAIVQYMVVNGKQEIMLLDLPEPDSDYEIYINCTAELPGWPNRQDGGKTCPEWGKQAGDHLTKFLGNENMQDDLLLGFRESDVKSQPEEYCETFALESLETFPE